MINCTVIQNYLLIIFHYREIIMPVSLTLSILFWTSTSHVNTGSETLQALTKHKKTKSVFKLSGSISTSGFNSCWATRAGLCGTNRKCSLDQIVSLQFSLYRPHRPRRLGPRHSHSGDYLHVLYTLWAHCSPSLLFSRATAHSHNQSVLLNYNIKIIATVSEEESDAVSDL